MARPAPELRSHRPNPRRSQRPPDLQRHHRSRRHHRIRSLARQPLRLGPYRRRRHRRPLGCLRQTLRSCHRPLHSPIQRPQPSAQRPGQHHHVRPPRILALLLRKKATEDRGMNSMNNVLVMFQADTECTEQMALAVAVGAVEAEANIRLRRLAAPHAVEVIHKGYGKLQAADLLWANSLAIGLESPAPKSEELGGLL